MRSLLLSLLIGMLIIAAGICAAQTDNRVPVYRDVSFIGPHDQNNVPYTPEMTYINSYFHYEIGTFNAMTIDTLNDVKAVTASIVLPRDAARAFVIRNNAADSTFEWWLDTDVGDHRFIKPGVSQYIPCAGNTLHVKTVATPPDLQLEFGK